MDDIEKTPLFSSGHSMKGESMIHWNRCPSPLVPQMEKLRNEYEVIIDYCVGMGLGPIEIYINYACKENWPETTIYFADQDDKNLYQLSNKFKFKNVILLVK